MGSVEKVTLAAHVAAAHSEVSRLATAASAGDQYPVRFSIPARPDYDTDLVLARALCDLEEEVLRLREGLREKVKAAYCEGFRVASERKPIDNAWEDSKARKAIDYGEGGSDG